MLQTVSEHLAFLILEACITISSFPYCIVAIYRWNAGCFHSLFQHNIILMASTISYFSLPLNSLKIPHLLQPYVLQGFHCLIYFFFSLFLGNQGDILYCDKNFRFISTKHLARKKCSVADRLLSFFEFRLLISSFCR